MENVERVLSAILLMRYLKLNYMASFSIPIK